MGEILALNWNDINLLTNTIFVTKTVYFVNNTSYINTLAQPDTQVVYSEEFRNPCALYTTEDGSRYKVWYENEQSVLDKVALARMFGITGVSLWRIGNIPADGTYDVWSALLTQR